MSCCTLLFKIVILGRRLISISPFLKVRNYSTLFPVPLGEVFSPMPSNKMKLLLMFRT